MMVAAALFLMASLALTIVVHRREEKRVAEKGSAEGNNEADSAEKPLGAEGGSHSSWPIAICC